MFLEYSITDMQSGAIQLAKKVEYDGFKPDSIVYIAKGGYLIGKPISEHFDVPLYEVCINRSGDSLKTNASSLLISLPRFLKYLLRRVELKVRLSHKAGADARESTEVDFYLIDGTNDPKNILLVDDSVDTGRTMLLAKKHLEKVFPGCVIRSAALNIFENSVIAFKTDYSIHVNQIMSLPSSKDNKHYEEFMQNYNDAIVRRRSHDVCDKGKNE